MAKDKATAKATAEAQSDALSIIEGSEGQGFENVTSEDVLIPRLIIIQKLSPQADRNDAAFIEGAVEGMICNTASNALFESVEFLPIAYRKSWLEWSPRTEARRIIHTHNSKEVLSRCAEQDGKWMLGQNEVQETASFYGYQITLEDGAIPAFIAMKTTQLRTARRWMHMASSASIKRDDGTRIQPPLWFYSYNLGTVQQTNPKGSWFGWTIERKDDLPALTDRIGEQAADMAERCKQLHGSFAQAQISVVGTEGGEQAKIEVDPDLDDEIPF